jgi:dihydroxyacetone kinase-like predicted kinase
MDLSEENVETILEQARDAMKNATTGVISPAIRTADLDGVHIEDGDFIGFVGKQMLVSEKKCAAAACALCDKMLDDEKFMLTVFTGKSAEEADNQAIEAHVQEAHPDVECYFIEGGQDVYPYIFIVE